MGGNYSREETIWGNTVISLSGYFKEIHFDISIKYKENYVVTTKSLEIQVVSSIFQKPKETNSVIFALPSKKGSNQKYEAILSYTKYSNW